MLKGCPCARSGPSSPCVAKKHHLVTRGYSITKAVRFAPLARGWDFLPMASPLGCALAATAIVQLGVGKQARCRSADRHRSRSSCFAMEQSHDSRSSASSPTKPPSPASSGQSCSNRSMNGRSSALATSHWKVPRPSVMISSSICPSRRPDRSGSTRTSS